MDLNLFARVVWRFRFLVAAGIALALALAFLSFMRITVENGSPVFSYREDEQWQGVSTLLLSQRGFPWGRSIVDTDPDTELLKPNDMRFGEAQRFANLAVLYSRLVVSDPVKQRMLRDGPIDGEISAQPVVATETGNEDTLPLVEIRSTATTPQAALALAARATEAFQAFLEDKQASNGIKLNDRVTTTVVERPEEATLAQARSVTRPLVVFLTVALAVVGLAFVVENLRPRIKPVAADDVRLRRSA